MSYSSFQILSCTKEDSNYPEEMRAIKGMPSKIFYKGAIEIINQKKNIAVIGSRKCSEKGRELSYHTGRIVGMKDMNLVNGLALGCDTEALRGALSVGGKCIAVMPCGLEQIQPKSNERLAEQILENGGCIISEYPVGTPIQRYRYVERDRLQSGISQGVLIVEAEQNSGTMHTADFAKRQYKRLACYYEALFRSASGNKYLADSKKAEVLKNEEDLNKYLKSIAEQEEYKQLSFEF